MKLRENDVPKLLRRGFMLVRSREFLRHGPGGPSYIIIVMTPKDPEWRVMKSCETAAEREKELESMGGWDNVLIIED